MIPALSAELRPAWLLRGPLGAAGARSAIHQLHRHADDAFMLKQPFLQPHQSPGFLSRKISTLEFVVFFWLGVNFLTCSSVFRWLPQDRKRAAVLSRMNQERIWTLEFLRWTRAAL